MKQTYERHVALLQDRQQARQHLERAVAIGRQRLPPTDRNRIQYTTSLATECLRAGRPSDARALYDEAHKGAEALNGGRTTTLIGVLNDSATLDTVAGDFAAAEAKHRRTLALAADLLGADSRPQGLNSSRSINSTQTACCPCWKPATRYRSPPRARAGNDCSRRRRRSRGLAIATWTQVRSGTPLMAAIRPLVVSVLSAPALLACMPVDVEAQALTIGIYQKVSERRIPRSETEFTYRATLINGGPAMSGAKAIVTSLSPATTIVDGSLMFGSVASGGTAPSLDTFTFRHDRTVPFDWVLFQWTVTSESVNQPPVADAGFDQTITVGSSVQLDGSRSTDADGAALTFAWSFEAMPPGSAAILNDPASVNPTFTADVRGTYVLRLTVNDDAIDSAPDAVSITTENSPPVADAGPDQTRFLGETVTLDGSASTDADGDPLTFSWTLVSQPAASAAVLSDASTVQPTFVIDATGSYVIELVVHDGTASSAPDTVTIATGNTPPVADAGPAQSVSIADLVTLDGSGSSDVNGDALRFSWSFTTRPTGSAAMLSSAASATPSFVPDLAGTYVVQLIVNDGLEDSDPDTVTLTTANPAIVGVTFVDNDASEGGSDPGTFSISRLGPTTNDLVVFYTMAGTATPGMDYAAPAASVTIPAGSSAATVTIAPIDDTLIEGPELAILVLSAHPSSSIGLRQASVTITDDERPAVTIVATDDTAAEAGSDPATFTIARTGPTTAPLTVSYDILGSAGNGTDYETISATATLPSGSATVTVTITPMDDQIFEGSEFVIVTLNAGPDYTVVTPGLAAVTIVDNDGAQVTIAATDATASEAGDPGTFTIARTGGNLTQQLLVLVSRSGTALDGRDYADLGGANFFVTIAANELSATVTITPFADAIVEGDETDTLTIVPRATYVIGTPGSATVTIVGR